MHIGHCRCKQSAIASATSFTVPKWSLILRLQVFYRFHIAGFLIFMLFGAIHCEDSEPCCSHRRQDAHLSCTSATHAARKILFIADHCSDSIDQGWCLYATEETDDMCRCRKLALVDGASHAVVCRHCNAVCPGTQIPSLGIATTIFSIPVVVCRIPIILLAFVRVRACTSTMLDVIGLITTRA